MSFLDKVQKYFGIGKYSKWTNGLLKELIGRPNSKSKYMEMYPCSMPLVEDALKTFCEAMDIKSVQMYNLRPTDKIIDIYLSVRFSDSTDDLELERLILGIEKKRRTKLDAWFTKEKTIQDWIEIWIKE